MEDAQATQGLPGAVSGVVVATGKPITCSKCGNAMGTVEAAVPFSITVHCSFCGDDFGMKVVPHGRQAESAETANPPAGGWRP